VSTDDVRLRPWEPADLPGLEAWAPTGKDRTHEQRFARHEAGTSTYLLAHLAGDPDAFVGSCEIRWDGCADPSVPRSPEVNGLQVWPEHLQSHGIGTQILLGLEPLVAARGHDVVGLGVSEPRARALYLRLGYVDDGVTYLDRWTRIDDDGREHRVADPCQWLTKQLAG
jgi:GNAT superfamily N-acetyltransferase